ncbi:MAG: TatD family hydrolase [Woeseiaceae bacterium]|nr:TatD family hydrolase [Woeseiaceae bacterium]
MQLIDIGANLAHNSFDDDRDAVLERASDVGVTRLILTGSSEDSNREVLQLAKDRPGQLWSTAGVHPHHATDYTDEVHLSIQAMLNESEVVAVGECGLDYFRNFSPADAQRVAFERQLELAEQFALPVFLHQRDAQKDFVDILRPRLPNLSRAVAHCFTGSETELRELLDLDLYIGITGWICDERRGTHLKDIVALIPDDRLMIETDAPYLLPRSLRPKPKTRRNEPAWLTEVLQVVAEARCQSPEEVAATTSKTAEVFFSLPSAS